MRMKVLVAIVLVIVIVASGAASTSLFITVSPNEPSSSEHRTARLWVDLTSVPSGAVKAEDRWGTVETFNNAKVGTTTYYRNVSLTKAPVSTASSWAVMSGR